MLSQSISPYTKVYTTTLEAIPKYRFSLAYMRARVIYPFTSPFTGLSFWVVSTYTS